MVVTGANGRRPGTAWRTLDRANRATLVRATACCCGVAVAGRVPLNVSWSGTAARRPSPWVRTARGTGPSSRTRSRTSWSPATGSSSRTSTSGPIRRRMTRAATTSPPGCATASSWTRAVSTASSGDILATELNTGVRIARGASDHQILDSDVPRQRHEEQRPRHRTPVPWASTSRATTTSWPATGSPAASPAPRSSAAATARRSPSTAVVTTSSTTTCPARTTTSSSSAIPRTRDTLIAYNVDHSTPPDANFAVVHGLGSRYGPVHDTRHRPQHGGAHGQGLGRHRVLPRARRATTSQVVGNIVWGERNAATCDDGFVEADNIYWASDGHPSVTFDICATSRDGRSPPRRPQAG